MSAELLRFFIFQDLLIRRITPNRPQLRRWMNRPKDQDPFPAPVIISEGKLQANSKKPRYSGRRVAWKADEVESWVARNFKKAEDK